MKKMCGKSLGMNENVLRSGLLMTHSPHTTNHMLLSLIICCFFLIRIEIGNTGLGCLLLDQKQFLFFIF